MIKNCKFQSGLACHILVNNLGPKIFTPSAGVCYVFNFGIIEGNVTANSPTADSGLQLDIDINSELNDFFKKLNDRIKSGLSYSNYQSWVDENFKNNNKSNIFLYVQDRYEPIPFLSVNLESYVGYFIEQEFAFRYNLIFTLLIDLHEIYSEHLFLTSNRSLLSTPTKLNKTDITEVVYLLEKYGNFEKFSDFKSTILQMLQISNDDYSKSKTNILNRKKGKFQFISEVLKQENYYVDFLKGN